MFLSSPNPGSFERSGAPGWVALLTSLLAHGLLVFGLGLVEHLGAGAPRGLVQERTSAQFWGNTFEVSTVATSSPKASESSPPPAAATPSTQPQPESDSTTAEPRTSPSKPDVPAPRAQERDQTRDEADTRGGQSSNTSASSGEETQPGGGRYGQSGLPVGVADLRSAFIKTLPLAAKSHAGWHELPVGWTRAVQVRLTLGPEGRLSSVVIEDTNPPALLTDLVEMNQRFLNYGRFAWSDGSSAGEQRLALEVTVEQHERQEGEPELAHALGLLTGTPPRGSYLTFYSGRHLEFVVRDPRH